MIFRLLMLHLRWFALFAFVGVLTVIVGHGLDGGFSSLSVTGVLKGLMPILSLSAALGVAVPWLMFIIDPKRAHPVSVDGFIAHWKLRP